MKLYLTIQVERNKKKKTQKTITIERRLNYYSSEPRAACKYTHDLRR